MKALFIVLALVSLTYSSVHAQQNCNGDRIMVYKGGKGCGCTCKKKCISQDDLQVYLDNGWNTWGCFNCCWVSIDNDDNRETALTEVYTLPDSRYLNVEFTLASENDVTIQVTDMSGQLVATVANEYFDDAENELIWNKSELNPGLYLLTIQAGDQRDTQLLSVLN